MAPSVTETGDTNATGVQNWKEDAESCLFPTLVAWESSKKGVGTITFDLPVPKSALLGRYPQSRQHGVEIVLTTAWAMVLRAYTGNMTVSFGLSISDADELFGSGVCSVSVYDESSLNTTSQIIHQKLFRAGTFQALKGSSAQASSRLNGSTLFNTALDFSSGYAFLEEGIDLRISFQALAESFKVELDYSLELIDEVQAEDIALAFQHILSELINNPTAPYCKLNLTNPTSLAKLFAWNSWMPESVDRCVGDLFHEQAIKHPMDFAVNASDITLTYAELDSMSQILAWDLQSRGLKPESVVLLCFPKSAWAVVAMMAVIRAGGTMLFLDASHPKARLQEIQGQVNAGIMLTAPQYADMWEWTGAETLVVNQALMNSLQHQPVLIDFVATPSNMLYIIFTSGSTGKPKGCCIEHRQFLTGCYAQRKASGMLRSDRVLQLASFTFDVSMLEIVTSLITGACVCIPGDEIRAKGPAHCIQEFGVTWAFLTPSLVKLMTPEMVPSLRFLVLGGEALGATDVKTWAPHLQLANGYGPTECSVAATAYPKLTPTTDPANIGYPLGALCWLVDPRDHRRLVPPGALGELLVHGSIVARGYFKDAAKTDAVFVNDFPWLPGSFSGEDRRMYKTGDLARYNSDGTINFIGRKDSQVKLRGLRIELGEVENQIAVNKLVGQAVVVLPRTGPCKNQLTVVMAFKGREHGAPGGTLELVDTQADPFISTRLELVKKSVAELLPTYMLPSVWIIVHSIPLTISGKLNRVAVSTCVAELDDRMYGVITGVDSAAPASSPAEHQVQTQCSELLRVPLSQIHLNRSFVNNGGDSVLGMRLLSKLRAIGVQATMKDLIESQTLSEFAEKVMHVANVQVTTYTISYDLDKFRHVVLPHLPIENDNIQDVYPLGPMQSGIVLSQKTGSATYDLRVLCKASASNTIVNTERLKGAWVAVTNRHTSLRTIFPPSISDDAPADQVVLRHVLPQIETVSCQDEDEVTIAVKKYRIKGSTRQPRVNFVVFQTPGATYCMVAADHALVDGISVQLLFRDLSAAYAGSLDGTEEMHFSQYIGYLQQLEKPTSLAYWKSYLDGVGPCRLLFDEDVEKDQLSELTTVIEPYANFQSICRERGITTASVVQCAWGLTLRAYTGLDDVCFGYLSSGRDAPVSNIENTVGAFINMLVCRLRISDSDTLLELVESTQKSFLNALPHQHCSLAEVLHELGTSESLFNTVISLQGSLGDIVGSKTASEGLSFDLIDEVDPTEYDLSVNVSTLGEGQGIHVSLRHYASKVSHNMARRILDTLKFAMERIMKGHDQRFADVPMLSQRDEDQIMSWNESDWQDRNSCIHEEFAKQVQMRGNAIAIDAWDGSLTYGQLDDMSSLLASYLVANGVGPEVLVPLSFEKSFWVPVAQLAVLKAGGACVAIDPAQPLKRRQELLHRCDATIAVTSKLHKGLHEGLVGKEVIVDQKLLDTLARDSFLHQSPVPWRRAMPSNTAFVVFTSGSTGIPKGIVLEHHSLVVGAHTHGPFMRYGPDKRILQFASYTFDVSVGESMYGLMLGATLCIPNEEERIDDLAGVISRMGVNVVYLTPSVASLLEPFEVPKLEVLALGGETVRAENITTWADKVHLINIYGPAECTVWSTGLSPVPRGTSPANIGRGIGARMWITEPGSPEMLCPIGAVGELLIEGPIVARGYLKDAEKTSAGFVRPPRWLALANSTSGTSRTLYRTGDLVRYNEDGSIHFIGRRDFQIKLHGQRIEMGDIEHHLRSHGSVANAVIVYSEDGLFARSLVAIISLRKPAAADGGKELALLNPAQNPTVAEAILQVRDHLSARVPGYMMPSVFFIADTIPITGNGKTDRKKVSSFIGNMDKNSAQAGGWDTGNAVILPDTPVETTLRGIISSVLGVVEDNISMDQSFLNLGGDSITAMQLSVRCRKSQMSVSVKDILQTKSIRQLAGVVKQSIQAREVITRHADEQAFSLLPEADLDVINRKIRSIGLSGVEEIEDAYPVSPMQQGLLIAQAQAGATYRPYVICEVTSTKGGPKPTAEQLALAWQRVVDRHAMLRTVFFESSATDGLFFQVVLKKATARVGQVTSLKTLKSLPQDDPLDYDDPSSPHRVTICEADDKLHFNLEISHTLIDGASMAIILKDLSTAFREERLAPGPGYRDYVSFLSEQSRQDSMTYWKGQLAGAEPCMFPKLLSRNVVANTLNMVDVPLQGDIAGRVNAFSKKHGVTIANILQTAWALVLRSYSGSTDVAFGFMASGRDVPISGIEEAVGPFINMLVCRMDLADDVRVLDAILKSQNDYLDALPHQHMPLAELQHALDIPGGRLFNTIVSLQRHLSSPSDHDGDVRIEYVEGSDPTEYDLSISINANESTIEASIAYWSSFMSPEQAYRVASTFSQVLDEIVDPQAITIADVSLVCKSDRDTIFRWNRNGVTPAKTDEFVYNSFSWNVLERPEALAVDSWDGSFTYHELDEASLRLSHHLRDLGVTSEIIVPLAFDKSKWSVVAMLAVLRAGGAYASMDPTSPTQHLANIVEQVSASLVLTNSVTYTSKLKTVVNHVLVVDEALTSQLPVQKQIPTEFGTPNKAAFVTFTSGSTGKPKAICLTHSSLSSVVADNTDMGIGPDSRVFQFSAYIFDTSNFEIWAPLISGGCVCIPSEQERLNDLTGAINRLRINWSFLTPSIASLIVPADVPHLKTLALIGEMVREDLVDRWMGDVRLINSYGPSECTVCTTMAVLGRGDPAATINKPGYHYGSLLWIADATNVNKLAPIGAVGELLIEGPILARGYLDAEKTAKAFIAPPQWRGSTDAACRMYRSGDLVRYNEDGALVCVGRADGQIKLNGQRIETSEIEGYIVAQDSIRYGAVLVPKTGPCKRKLVAVVALSDFSEQTTASGEPRPIMDQDAKVKAISQIARVKKRLQSQVPGYMVPSVWLLSEAFPLTASKKVDRGRLSRWVQGLSNDEYLQALDVSEKQDTKTGFITPAEKSLQKIVASVLGVPDEQILLNQSFLNLGGDSILAMNLVVKCRKKGLQLTVKDVLRSKTISALALTLEVLQSHEPDEEEVFDAPFGLSPIQTMYFSELTKGSLDPQINQFNQSFLLSVRTRQSDTEVSMAVQKIVEHHSMLRARYHQDEEGVWSQSITSHIVGSYRYRVHDVLSRDDALAIARASQEQLDIQNGPVFAVELFNIAGISEQLLFMVAHHLVIDLVSWRTIIGQMDGILAQGIQLSGTKPKPFRSWVEAQAKYSSLHLTPETSLLHDVPDSDYCFWGMEDKSNVLADVDEIKFAIGKEDTDLLLRGCHRSMKTEALDLFLAAAFFSFAQTFSRSPPAIFNEGHGREPWETQMDITETVGWFTTMFPLHVKPDLRSRLDTIKRLKDQRRSLMSSGWAYFNSATSNYKGKRAFQSHWPVELLFNYHGVYQDNNREASIFAPIPFNEGDVGPMVRRFALVDINAYVLQGKANFALAYNRNMKHVDLIKKWAVSLKETVISMAYELKDVAPTITSGDYPLLPTTNEILEDFQRSQLPEITSIDNIEDMLACSPMQEGILLSQSRLPGAYHIEMLAELSSTSGDALDLQKLGKAWQMVVDRHSILRTVFVQKASQQPFDQLVLKKHSAKILIGQTEDDLAMDTLQSADAKGYNSFEPPHQMTILQTQSGRVFCKLQISHALSDGTSMSILVSDWLDIYQDEHPSVPGPLYSNYVAYINTQSVDSGLAYWKNYLSAVRPCHIPTSTDNDRSPTRLLHEVIVQIPSASKVRNFCQQHNITLASIFRLAWAKVLRAFTGDENVCFGYLASGRDVPVPGIDHAVGPFITMLVCSMDMTDIGHLRVVDSLQALQEDYLSSLPFQHLGLAKIQHELGMVGQKLFNTVLSFQRSTRGNGTVGEVNVHYLDGVDPTEYDVSVSIADGQKDIHVQMNYFTDRICDSQAANIAAALSNAVASILEGPEVKVARLPLYGTRDMETLSLWNSQPWEPVNECVHEIFSRKSRESPNATAIDSSEGSMTYQDLDVEATRLANELVTLGIKRDTLVPIAFEKSPWAIVAMLGVMKTGAGFVPLDPSHPDDRLKTIISQTASDLVLVSNSTSQRIKNLVKRVLTVPVQSPQEELSPILTNTTVSPSSVAYVLFTSGSTGLPKGVVLSHLAVSSSITHHGAEVGCSAATRMYQFAAYTFDASIFEIFTTLAYGGCVCVPSESERMGDVVGFINRKSVNTAFMTPSVVRILAPEQIPTMQTLVLGGEALGQDNIEVWAKKVRLMNGYGPTETCVFAVMKTFEHSQDLHDVLGKGVGSQTWIVNLDDPTQLAPIGAVGMLHLTGPSLAEGYLHEQAKSRKAFLEAPAFLNGVQGKQRAYNTGDLARYNSDGTILYLGRQDQQIKLRGQRIELSEIQHHVKRSFSLASQISVDIVFPNHQEDRATLAAFFCFDNNSGHAVLPDWNALCSNFFKVQKDLEDLLPPYEIPTLYVPVEKMPTTTAGKLDRKALRDMIAELEEEKLLQFSLVDVLRKPLEGHIQEQLALLWSDILKVPLSRIGGNDSFFRLGGDSLGAMKLAASSIPEISLTVSDIFRHPILADMAAAANKTSPGENISDIEPFALLPSTTSIQHEIHGFASKCNVPESQIVDAYPSTPLQESLMVLSILQPGSYTMRKAFKVPNSVDKHRFKTAWEMTIENNPILRTTIIQNESGHAIQVVLSTPAEWRDTPTLQGYIENDLTEGMTFGKPLSRYALTGDGHFVWTMHHSMYDGWMLPLIFDQFSSYYTTGITRPNPGFNTFIHYLEALNHDNGRAFWERYLSGQTPATFPDIPSSYRPRVDQETTFDMKIHRRCDSELPMATVIRAAWAYVLAQYSETGDVVFGMTLSGRNCPVSGITEIVGPTITTVPVRVKIPTEGTLDDFLRTVQEQSTEMIRHEHFGLQNIANLNSETSLATKFQNLLVVQPMAQFDVHHDELLGEEVSEPLKNFDTYPLTIECSLDDMRIRLDARFDGSIVSAARAKRLLHHFGHVIEVFNTSTATTRIKDISMLSSDDYSQVMDWNAKYPDIINATVPEVFAGQVQLRPDALAVDAWDGKLTYAELDRLSTSFAQYLTDHRVVGPETLVPICFEKSRWAVVTQLSVMKAGGAIVNLDPAHPLSRLELILQDAKANILLVSSALYDTFKDVRGIKLVAIDETFYSRLDLESTTILPRIDPSSAAYVLFTSGSTGRPKGIVVEHRNLCSSSNAHGAAWDIGPGTRVLQFAAYTFDVSCADIFTTLQRGGCICVPSEHDRLNNLAGAINEFQCNWAFLTPTVASLLPANDLPSLQKLVLGGEASTRDTIAKWHQTLDLIVCYGPAECSIYCSGASPATATSDPADLGAAIGALYWITDPSDPNRLMPVGCVGELLLEGPTVARGYLHDEQKTADAFICNPTWANNGSTDQPRRFYRTGDLVRFNDDGTIHFVGRKDTQIKVRGQRVELGEIEHAIRVQVPDLAHVTVDAARLAILNEKQVLVAFLHMSASGSSSDEILSLDNELREKMIMVQSSLANALPSYMVPDLFIPMAKVPLTMNGKADRRQLREMVSRLSRKKMSEYMFEASVKQLPTTNQELVLRDLWAECLEVGPETVGIDDQFFRIGGDSILAMRLVSIASERRIPLVVRDFFESPVLSDMAKALEGRSLINPNVIPEYKPFSLIQDITSAELVKNIASQIGTPESNVADVLPATDFQQTAAAHVLMRTRGFRNYLWLDGMGHLDATAAEKAMRAFVAEHEILRTVFALHKAAIVQVVLKELCYMVEWHHTTEDIATFTDQICKRDIDSPARLTDPLLKFIILTASDTHHRIIIRMSHAQYDGLSLPKLWDSLAAALESRPSLTPAKPMSTYMQFVASQDRNRTLDYWRSVLEGSMITTLVPHNKPSYRNAYDAELCKTIPTPAMADSSATFATVLKAAWSLVLASVTATRDVVFGHVVSGRTFGFEAGISDVVGPCINIVPVRVSLTSPTLSVSQLLQAVQSQHAAGVPHEGIVGTQTIIRECAPLWPRHARLSSIVQHQNIEETSNLSIRGVDYNVGFFCPQADEADLAIKTTPRGETTDILLICSDKVFNAEARERLMGLLCDTIQMLCNDPHEQISKLLKGMSTGTVETMVGKASHDTRDAIVTAWQDVLKLPQKTISTLDDDADFFELGGDLISAAILSEKLQINNVGGIGVEAIIDNSTLSGMVSVLC